MRKIEDYVFIDWMGRLKTGYDSEFYIRGKTGSILRHTIITDPLLTWDTKKAETTTGKEYELGEINKDFWELLEIEKTNEFPILTDWDLRYNIDLTHRFHNSVDECENGYVLTGFLKSQKLPREFDAFDIFAPDLRPKVNSTRIIGEIVSQDGNIVTLRDLDSEEEKEFFVIWAEPSENAESNTFRGKISTLDYNILLESAFGVKCRPHIPRVHPY